MRTCLLAMFLPTILLAAPQPGDEGTPEFRSATEFVEQLGSPRFAVREAAANKLLKMGGPAIPALIAGTKSADAEVRNRSIALLPQVQAIAWGRRADAFLNDPDGKRRHDLPLLSEWEKLTGKPNAGSRLLFAEMIRANGPLLQLASTDRAAAVAALATRSRELLDAARAKGKQTTAPAANIAAVLFVQTVLKNSSDHGEVSNHHAPLFLLANPAVATALDAKETGPAYRRLVVRWAESRPGDETMSKLFFALLAHRHPFPEAIPHLVRLATTCRNVQIRWVAMESLGKSKDKIALAKLTELLADTTTMYDNLDESSTGNQVRDCALAALANGLGKKPIDYGLTDYMTANFWVGGEADTISIHLYGFKSAAARDGGMKKWQSEWARKK